jgi:hypothetical protein
MNLIRKYLVVFHIYRIFQLKTKLMTAAKTGCGPYFDIKNFIPYYGPNEGKEPQKTIDE